MMCLIVTKAVGCVGEVLDSCLPIELVAEESKLCRAGATRLPFALAGGGVATEELLGTGTRIGSDCSDDETLKVLKIVFASDRR